MVSIQEEAMKVQIYLPDELGKKVKSKSVNVSKVCRDALAAQLDWLDRLLDRPNLDALVALYFDPAWPFAGELFDRHGINDPNHFGNDDLLALTWLNVAVGPQASRSLVVDHAGDELLQAVPDNVELWKATPGDLAKADALWRWLVRLPEVGEVTAGKLMARKRPYLIPIVDEVVGGFVPAEPHRYWETIKGVLEDEEDGVTRRARLAALRPAGVSVGVLRMFDVAVWMAYSKSRNAIEARRTVNFSNLTPAAEGGYGESTRLG
jgi:hypothetical protein